MNRGPKGSAYYEILLIKNASKRFEREEKFIFGFQKLTLKKDAYKVIQTNHFTVCSTYCNPHSL